MYEIKNNSDEIFNLAFFVLWDIGYNNIIKTEKNVKENSRESFTNLNFKLGIRMFIAIIDDLKTPE